MTKSALAGTSRSLVSHLTSSTDFLRSRGYECLLVEDATESYFPQFKASVLDMVRAQGGIVGWTGASTAILRSLKRA